MDLQTVVNKFNNQPDDCLLKLKKGKLSVVNKNRIWTVLHRLICYIFGMNRFNLPKILEHIKNNTELKTQEGYAEFYTNLKGKVQHYNFHHYRLKLDNLPKDPTNFKPEAPKLHTPPPYGLPPLPAQALPAPAPAPAPASATSTAAPVPPPRPNLGRQLPDPVKAAAATAQRLSRSTSPIAPSAAPAPQPISLPPATDLHNALQSALGAKRIDQLGTVLNPKDRSTATTLANKELKLEKKIEFIENCIRGLNQLLEQDSTTQSQIDAFKGTLDIIISWTESRITEGQNKEAFEAMLEEIKALQIKCTKWTHSEVSHDSSSDDDETPSPTAVSPRSMHVDADSFARAQHMVDRQRASAPEAIGSDSE